MRKKKGRRKAGRGTGVGDEVGGRVSAYGGDGRIRSLLGGLEKGVGLGWVSIGNGAELGFTRGNIENLSIFLR